MMKPLASIVRIMIAKHCNMPSPLLKVRLSSKQRRKCLMNFLELELDMPHSLVLSVYS